MTLIFAHRGYSKKYAENTLEAFEAALKSGADGIECDVRLTKDGRLVIIHDETVNRTTNGKGKVKNFTLNELKKLKAGKKCFFFRRNIKIPTLDELFNWAKTNDSILNIEMKYDDKNDFTIGNQLIEKIEKYEFESRVIISSFNHQMMEYYKMKYSHIEFAILFKNEKFIRESYLKDKYVDGVHPNKQIVRKKDVNILKALNTKLRPYTINKKRDMKRLIKWGVDGIITDDPKRAYVARKKYDR